MNPDDFASMDSLDFVNPYLYRYKKRNFLVKDKMRPKDLDELQHFEIQPTDIFLVTYPKSGTQWMQQILVKIMDAADPDWVEDANNRVRIPWLEERAVDDPYRERPAPRIFGSHLPPDMLPHGVKDKQIKIVYVWRNPKDVLVSLYHFAHSWVLLEQPQSFDEFFQQFLDGDVYMGSWFDQVGEYCAVRDQLNIHFVQYESMLKDLRGEVVKLCAFLEKDLTDEAIDNVVKMSTFKNMKTDPKANYKDFSETNRYKKETMRKGMAGDWKNHFTVAQNERFDRVFKEKMSDFPLTCIWEVKQ
ncbi:amine sulfotransferase-like isoform X2 [Chelmon rostratus]|uniref:amine sulfotransferase-like isoform X2 n=1 Tax=Chelmon rostratus TaxID=109905 RepID=UPI001BEA3B02|nr:amine sulfotransferase-like isoform X2 [Chelmon rostratus]